MKEEFKLKVNADVTIIEDKDVSVEVNIDLKELVNYVKETVQYGCYKNMLENNEFNTLYEIIEEYLYIYDYIDDYIDEKINKNDGSSNPLDIEINDVDFINIKELIEEIKPYINI